MSLALDRVCFETTSPEMTLALGAALGGKLVGGVTIALIGELGTGKTQLVKGIVTGNGSTNARQVTSPTFTLIHEYAGRFAFFHIDAYRLRGPAELMALGFDELVGPDTVVAIEWANRVAAVVPSDCMWIEISATGESQRSLAFSAGGDSATRCLSGLRSAWR